MSSRFHAFRGSTEAGLGLTTNAIIAATLLVISIPAATQSVSIAQPQPNADVSVHVRANAISSSAINISKIYLGGTIAYQVRSSAVDTVLNLTSGKHRLTAWPYDAACF